MFKSIRIFTISLCVFLTFHQEIQTTTIAEVFTIFSRYVQNPAQVGEVAPISQAAGFQLAKFLGQGVGGKKYLEAGGGCGAVSVCLAQALRAEDRLDVIEIDPEMCIILQQRLKEYPNVFVHCCSILDWNPGYLYDNIISTLPFNSLGIDFTKQAIAYFRRMAHENCIFSYVEYPIVKQALQYFYMGDRKRNFRAVQNFLAKMRKKYLLEQSMIYFNVPPVAIYHVCFNQK